MSHTPDTPLQAMQQRIETIIRQYDEQGIHRTGTDVDNASAQWLADCIRHIGVEPVTDSFSFQRVAVKQASMTLADMKMDGVPFYDGASTGAEGVSGTLGEVGSGADIGVAMVTSHAGGADYKRIIDARRERAHQAIVLVTDSHMPAGGVATINAEDYGAPFGPPVLQIPNDQWPRLRQAMEEGANATVMAQYDLVNSNACNVHATIEGRDSSLAPLVVMTPRSGWWSCASERGGGIATLLEIMRAIAGAGSSRDVIFTANTGHELGHTGLDRFLEKHQSLVAGAALWIHLGANFAARDGAVRLQYSDAEIRDLVSSTLSGLNLSAATETPLGQRPGGEARNIHDGSGRYVSILGMNRLFHHPADVWPDAVDAGITTRWARAFSDIALQLVSH